MDELQGIIKNNDSPTLYEEIPKIKEEIQPLTSLLNIKILPM
jgi:hypothetical protein